ncbi:MAG: phosphatidylserine decarboxylase family protein [Chitinophagaceae bacterium]
MTIHKEGYKSIAIGSIIYAVINLAAYQFVTETSGIFNWIIFIITTFLFLFLISFFRLPNRILTIDSNAIIAPADGKVVVIEEVYDEEYFKDKRLQLSVFMSPANVHVNRSPIDGIVSYSKYHKGKYLVAWDPKSSTENERHSVVIRKDNGTEILVKQIAGALAKRIVNYWQQPGGAIRQTEELGFIKFGSRVDLLLPVGTKINVSLGQAVKGGVSVLASFE